MRRIAVLSRPQLASILGSAIVFVSPLHAADFNGDGYADLAIGCRGETVSGFQEAGAVHVLYGGPTCFGAFTEQVINESSFVGEQPAAFELFGLEVAGGDFNGDGFDDLAIAATGERVSEFDAAGTVFVMYGSAAGLLLTNHQSFNQDTPGIKDKVEPGDFFFDDLSAETFGRTMVAGDFDSDGYDELVIHVVETLGKKKKKKEFAGAIHVLRGSEDGLTVEGNKLFHPDVKGFPGKAVQSGRFGSALAVADFNGDLIDDLAIGAPGEQNNGTVTILRGVAGKGLSFKKAPVLDEADAGGILTPTKSRHFGATLAAGDFAGTGGVQLAIGTPLLDLPGAEYAGGVYVVALTSSLGVASAALFTKATDGIDGDGVANAMFGSALAAGDFDDDGRDDLAIGCPQDLVGAISAAGSVTVIAGSSSGLSASAPGGYLLHEDVALIPDAAEYGDFMGTSLAAADYDSDGDTDLIIALDFEKIGSIPTAGAVLVIEGSPATLLDLNQLRWLDKSLPVVAGEAGSNDHFGSGLGR